MSIFHHPFDDLDCTIPYFRGYFEYTNIECSPPLTNRLNDLKVFWIFPIFILCAREKITFENLLDFRGNLPPFLFRFSHSCLLILLLSFFFRKSLDDRLPFFNGCFFF